jgi:hypothetical protein
MPYGESLPAIVFDSDSRHAWAVSAHVRKNLQGIISTAIINKQKVNITVGFAEFSKGALVYSQAFVEAGYNDADSVS